MIVVARAKIQGYFSNATHAFWVVSIALYRDNRYWKHAYRTINEPCTIEDLHNAIREEFGASQVYVQQQFWTKMPTDAQIERFWYGSTIDDEGR